MQLRRRLVCGKLTVVGRKLKLRSSAVGWKLGRLQLLLELELIRMLVVVAVVVVVVVFMVMMSGA